MKTTHAFVLSLLAATIVGCSSGTTSPTSSICARAVECEYIEAADQAECESDINSAIGDGKVSSEQVAECDKCARENKCGLDTVLDCGDECPADVSALVFGSNVN